MADAAMSDQFIEDMVAAAAGLASLYVGAPENEMMAALFDICADFEIGLAEKFGPDIALQIAQAFATAVICHRRNLEEAGGAATPPVLN